MYETLANVGSEKGRIDALERDRDKLVRELTGLTERSTDDE